MTKLGPGVISLFSLVFYTIPVNVLVHMWCRDIAKGSSNFFFLTTIFEMVREASSSSAFSAVNAIIMIRDC